MCVLEVWSLTHAKVRTFIKYDIKSTYTVKPVLSGHSKIDKTKGLMANGSLMKVESIAECSPWSILQYFWPALSDNRSWKSFFVFFLSGRLRQVLLYVFFQTETWNALISCP